MSVTQQLARVRAELPERVTLVAVSKTHPAELIREAYDAGQRIFGESRPQELREKYELLPKDIEWHMIGHLQTNKVKYIAPFVQLIHSVDSARLAEAIQTQAARCGRVIDILLEIHVAREETKSGWDPAQLRDYLAANPFAQLPNVRVRGVMGIATNTDDEAVIRFFADAWAENDAEKTAESVLSNKDFWSGKDLTEVPGLKDAVAGYLKEMDKKEIKEIMAELI